MSAKWLGEAGRRRRARAGGSGGPGAHEDVAGSGAAVRGRRPAVWAAAGVAGLLAVGGAIPAAHALAPAAGTGAAASTGVSRDAVSITAGGGGATGERTGADGAGADRASGPSGAQVTSADAYLEFDEDTTSQWDMSRVGLSVESEGWTPETALTVAIDGVTVDEAAASADGYFDFSFTADLGPGTYTMTITSAGGSASADFTVIADDELYDEEYRDQFEPWASASRFVVTQSELAAEPVSVEAGGFPESFSPGPHAVDVLVGGEVIDTVVVDPDGDVASEVAGPQPVGTRTVEFTNPVGTASVSFDVVSDEQGALPPAGTYEGTTLQTHAGSIEREEPTEEDFSFEIDEQGRMHSLSGEYWWFCSGGHGSGFNDYGNSEFPASPVTADQAFEFHWTGNAMDHTMHGTIRSDGTAQGRIWSSLGACGETIVEFTATNGDVPPPSPDPTDDPTDEPTTDPTDDPTDDPSPDPTDDPTDDPTSDPTDDPTPDPTTDPTDDPTTDPTTDPTDDPTSDPTTDPTDDPTTDPTDDPTADPTDDPTTDPTTDPTADPTDDPTTDPTGDPTTDPTGDPSEDPSSSPEPTEDGDTDGSEDGRGDADGDDGGDADAGDDGSGNADGGDEGAGDSDGSGGADDGSDGSGDSSGGSDEGSGGDSDRGHLPRTGTSAGATLMLALGMLVAGAVSLVVARASRQRGALTGL